MTTIKIHASTPYFITSALCPTNNRLILTESYSRLDSIKAALDIITGNIRHATPR